MKENKGKLTCTLYCFTHMHTHAHRYAYLHTHTGEQCIYHSRAHVHVNMHAYTHLPIPYMHILTIHKLFPGITLTISQLPVTHTEIHPRTRTQAPHVRTNHMRIHITNSHTLTSPRCPFRPAPSSPLHREDQLQTVGVMVNADGRTFYTAQAYVLNNSTIRTFADLQGKKSCHTGFSKSAGMYAPIGFGVQNGFIQTKGTLLETVASFFEASCAAPEMCDICKDSKIDGQCAKDTYSDYDGALQCLRYECVRLRSKKQKNKSKSTLLRIFSKISSVTFSLM